MIEKLYKAIQDHKITVNEISEAYNVSDRTVKRWLSGKVKPKLETQYKLTKLLDSDEIETISKLLKENEGRLRIQFDNLLVGLRESFYRWGTYSTRNEALEELCKLLLAQFSLLRQNKEGLHNFFEGEKKDYSRFNIIVNEALTSILGKYVDLSILNGNYHILITSDQSSLINEIVKEFKKVNWDEVTTLSRLDLFNEIFGRFLANSFVDEKEMGQYLTPIEMTRFMVQLAIQNLNPHELEILTNPHKCRTFGYILDPSCGAGSFLVEIIHQLLPIVIKNHGQLESLNWIDNMGKHVLCGIDKSSRMLRLTIFNFCSLGIPCENVYSINTLDKNNNSDILERKLEGKVRMILTNPPFGAEFSGNSLIKYKIFSKWSTNTPKKIDSEILFIERYVDWLVDSGICVTVVPDSVLTNRGLHQDLRNGIHPDIELQSIISFPSETFSAAGTSTKTSVMSFIKTNNSSSLTYFGICKNIGFKVITKGSNKSKVSTEYSDLDSILEEIWQKNSIYNLGRWIKFDDSYQRWDANYHASLNEQEYSIIQNAGKSFVRLHEVADLVNDRVDPRRLYKEFQYIEISDIQSSGIVFSNLIEAINAPSRARKQVKIGDVLVSTVRPEQKKIGYVINRNDNKAICTTGLAVLRPKSIEPSLLVELLKSDFVTKQIMRHNIGIAYPAVDENCFLELILPIDRDDIGKLNQTSIEVEVLKSKLLAMENNFKEQVNKLSMNWVSGNNLS